MAIASAYVESHDLFVVVWHGLVSGAEWKDNVGSQLDADPGWPRGCRRLIDLTTLDPTDLSSGDIDTVIDLARERMPKVAGRRQAVVASVAWDLAREFADRSNELGATTILFDRLESACAWLRVDTAAVRPVISTLRADLRSCSPGT